jgi:hypothetical protein
MSVIPQLEAEVQARTHAMAALLGSAEPVDLPEVSPIPGATLEPVLAQARLDVGLPSDLLLRRPDVRRAEAELEAALVTTLPLPTSTPASRSSRDLAWSRFGPARSRTSSSRSSATKAPHVR